MRLNNLNTMLFLPALFLDLQGIDQTETDNCSGCDSGVARVCLFECELIDIEASTFDQATGCITSLASTGIGAAAEYVPDKDDTSFINYVGERVAGVHKVNIDGFLKFKCLNKLKVTEANKLKDACCLVLMVEYNDCSVFIGGLDILKSCSVEGELRFATKQIEATVSLYGGTGADENRMEVLFSGQQRCFTMLDPAVSYDDVKALFAA